MRDARDAGDAGDAAALIRFMYALLFTPYIDFVASIVAASTTH